MKKKVFNIIQIGDKSNRLSRLFDIFIAIVICANILVTFLQTFDELAFLFPVFHVIEVITILIFCVEYACGSGLRTIYILIKTSSAPAAVSDLLRRHYRPADNFTLFLPVRHGHLPDAAGGEDLPFVPPECTV